jgi:hypothetical protein
MTQTPATISNRSPIGLGHVFFRTFEFVSSFELRISNLAPVCQGCEAAPVVRSGTVLRASYLPGPPVHIRRIASVWSLM